MKLKRLLAVTVIAGLALSPLGASAIAQSNDRHVGYYYPASEPVPEGQFDGGQGFQ